MKAKNILLHAILISLALQSEANSQKSESEALNYHLQHAGTSAHPADPNAAVCVDGVYHLHYIYNANGDKKSFDYAHVVSKDLVNWEWKPTNLTQKDTGAKMFSGTAFKTPDGRIGTIYQGNGNVIAIAKDKSLEQWEKPYRILPKNPRGVDEKLFRHWDPDLFVVDDTYYAVFGNLYFDLEKVPFLSKSKDLKNWEYVGPLMSKEMDDVLTAEDVSCANFFKLGEKWVLLCISHARGARYYIGEWDKTDEQFVPEFHGRLNHRHIYPSLPYCSIFAPESLLTDDGRRIVWFWLDGAGIGVQTLPREFSLPSDGILRMKPARELESLRLDKKTCKNLEVKSNPETSEQRVEYLFDLPSDAVEIGAEISRHEAEMNRVGFELFSDGDKNRGVQILFCADYKTLRVGGVEIPFELKTLPPNENLKIRIFVDKHIVEVFVNDRIAAAAIGRNPQIRKFHALGFKRPYKIEKIDVWNLKPANKGYKDALKNGIVK